jgi:hypothetical protein
MFLIEAGGSRPCSINPPGCSDPNVRVTGELDTPYYAYVCAFRADRSGVAGIDFGFDYDIGALPGMEWESCSDLEFPVPGFPGPGTGILVTWASTTNCQDYEPVIGEGVSAIAGYLYLIAYAPTTLEIQARNVGAATTAQIVNCDVQTTELDTRQLGWLGFSNDGSEEGSLPCLQQTVEDETWGGIKRTLGQGR